MQTEEKLAPCCSVVQIIPQQAGTGQLMFPEASMGWQCDQVDQEALVPGTAVPKRQNGVPPRFHTQVRAHIPSSWFTSLLTWLVD